MTFNCSFTTKYDISCTKTVLMEFLCFCFIYILKVALSDVSKANIANINYRDSIINIIACL